LAKAVNTIEKNCFMLVRLVYKELHVSM